MRYPIAALVISGLALTGAIFMNPGEAHAKEAGSGKPGATVTAPVSPGKAATNSGKNAVKAPKIGV